MSLATPPGRAAGVADGWPGVGQLRGRGRPRPSAHSSLAFAVAAVLGLVGGGREPSIQQASVEE